MVDAAPRREGSSRRSTSTPPVQSEGMRLMGRDGPRHSITTNLRALLDKRVVSALSDMGKSFHNASNSPGCGSSVPKPGVSAERSKRAGNAGSPTSQGFTKSFPNQSMTKHSHSRGRNGPVNLASVSPEAPATEIKHLPGDYGSTLRSDSNPLLKTAGLRRQLSSSYDHAHSRLSSLATWSPEQFSQSFTSHSAKRAYSLDCKEAEHQSEKMMEGPYSGGAASAENAPTQDQDPSRGRFKDRCIPWSPVRRPAGFSIGARGTSPMGILEPPVLPTPQPIIPSSRLHSGSLVRYIVYLEPSPSSVMCMKIENFWERSIDLCGRNEAHMYRPHVSATGYFDLPIPSEEGDEQNRQRDLWENVVINGIKTELEALSSRPSPVINGVSRVGPEALVLSITTPESYLKLFENLATKVKDQIRIRPKGSDHISLAYANKYITLPASRFNPGVVDMLEDLAMAMFGSDTKLLDDLVEWDLVVYRVSISRILENPHEFVQLKRWRVSGGRRA